MTLEAVEHTAVEAASGEADRIRRDANERAEQAIAQARAQAAALIAQRRAAAERLARLDEQQLLADARAQARTTVLRAQRSVLTRATAAVRSAAAQLPGDSRYGHVLERLSAEAHARLSPAGLEVELIDAPGGGFVARAGSRELDYSLDAQVDRCLREMAAELERLWQ